MASDLKLIRYSREVEEVLKRIFNSNIAIWKKLRIDYNFLFAILIKQTIDFEIILNEKDSTFSWL